MRFFRQEYWNGLLFPSPGDLPHSGSEPASLALAARFFTTEPAGKLLIITTLQTTPKLSSLKQQASTHRIVSVGQTSECSFHGYLWL